MRIFGLLCIIIMASGCSQPIKPSNDQHKPIQTIAFGSCNKQDMDQSFWPIIAAQNPDLWVWLGDNIYADTEDMGLMAAKYQQQKSNPYYQAFSKNIAVTGIWDDHDYGQNDGNRTFAFKTEAKQHFLDFMDIASDDPVNQHPGIYRSETFGQQPHQVKIIHLDTRTFQDPLERTPKGAEKNYVAQENGQILGAAQWRWLRKELNRSSANINIIASSLQVIAEDHSYEMWSNFPNQRKRLLDLLVLSGVSNPIIFSGDRHLSEISVLQWQGQEIIDITSSGLTHSFSGAEEFNRHRVGDLITDESFSTLTIDWNNEKIKIQQFDMSGNEINQHSIQFK